MTSRENPSQVCEAVNVIPKAVGFQGICNELAKKGIVSR
jgi:hypothetical protein